jgi:HlyD family secretion protein
MTRQRFVSCSALVAGTALAIGCGGSPAPQEPAAKTAGTLKVVSPEKKSLERVVEQPGTVQAYEETKLFARVPGYVRLPLDAKGRILTDIGRKIRGPVFNSAGKETEPGEVLAELVVPELEEGAKLKNALTRQAEAEVEQARKALASAEANIAKAAATVVEAKALHDHWESQSKRMTEAVKRGTIEAQIGDETLNQFKAAGARVTASEAAVRKATADRDKAAADVRAVEARVDVAKADALGAEAMLSYAKIRAPFDGVVTMRKVSTGDLVQPGGGASDWLFAVVRLDPVRVVIAVPEADADLVQEKAAVKLSIKAAQAPPFDGTVTRISWALEPGARTLRAEIDLPNKDGRLRPGMYVYAHIINRFLEAWTLPATAVVKHDDTMDCFLIEGGKAIRTPVQVGRGDGTFVEVLKRQKPGSPAVWGEFTGEEKIAAKASGLKDGQAVP